MANRSAGTAAQRRPRTRPGRAKTSGFRRWATRIVQGTAVAVLLVMILGIAGLAIGYARTDVPDPNKEFQANTSFVMWRDGSKLGSFASQNRQTIPYSEMPDSLKNAAVAAENRSFWTDGGISPSGMIRALWVIARGGEVQGGSTITQQYIKVMYLTQERTLERKLKELFIAVKLGREVPKEDILAGYLNTIYFGRGAYGAQAAARSYFDVDAKDLTVPQAAFLAAAINNPGAYDPSEPENMDRITERYHYVLDGMLEMGTLTPQQRADWDELPQFPEIPINERYAGPNGHLMKMVEDELRAEGFTSEEINGGGLQITTTFDPRIQQQAVATAQDYQREMAANAGLDGADLHPAIASVDNATGEVLGLYGGPDYITDQRNWATTPRQTGSTFKTFALAAGLRDGFGLYDSFTGNTFTPEGETVESRNEFGMQYGQVDLIDATANSINTAFVDMTTQMDNGGEKIARAAQDAGAPAGPGWDTNTSRISLGIAEVSPLQMAGAYGTFANGGRQVAPHVVKEVKDFDGAVVHTGDTRGREAFGRDLSADVTYALQQVNQYGTGTRVTELGRPTAGKTGTAGLDDKIISAWYVGFTRQISTAVMLVAGPEGTGDLGPYKSPGDQTFFGGTYPAMMWLDFMQVATDGQPAEQFDDPAFINGNRTGGRSRSGNGSGSGSNGGGRQRNQPAPRPSAPPSPAPEPPASTGPTPGDGGRDAGQNGSGQGDAGQGGSNQGGSGQGDGSSGSRQEGSGDAGSGSGDAGSGSGGSGSGGSGSRSLSDSSSDGSGGDTGSGYRSRQSNGSSGG